jgi:hypothetical protein
MNATQRKAVNERAGAGVDESMLWPSSRNIWFYVFHMLVRYRTEILIEFIFSRRLFMPSPSTLKYGTL